MNTKNNQRSRTTKSIIKSTILQLLEEGEVLSSISVAKLCRIAGIHRSTFYSHYSIPDDVFREIEQDMLGQAIANFSNMTPENTIAKIEQFLSFIKENLQVMRIFFIQTRTSYFIEKLEAQVENDLLQSITRLSSSGMQFLLPYLIEGSRGIIAAWIQNGCQTDEHELAVFINRCNQFAVIGVQSF